MPDGIPAGSVFRDEGFGPWPPSTTSPLDTAGQFHLSFLARFAGLRTTPAVTASAATANPYDDFSDIRPGQGAAHV